MIFMKRRFVLIVVGFLAVINGLLVLRLFTAHAAENDPDSGYAQIAVFAKAIQLLRQDYVDDNKTSYHDLVYAAMKGMLASLDPHSQFMEPDDFREMQDDTRSRFNGLGIEVSTKNGVLTVVTPMEDTPAAKAGILAGDQILKINGTPTEKLELQQAVNLLPLGHDFPDTLNSLDMRFGKNLRFGGTRTNVAIDLYNVFNANTGTAYNQTYDPITNGATWLAPSTVLNPRFARFNVTFNF